MAAILQALRWSFPAPPGPDSGPLCPICAVSVRQNPPGAYPGAPAYADVLPTSPAGAYVHRCCLEGPGFLGHMLNGGQRWAADQDGQWRLVTTPRTVPWALLADDVRLLRLLPDHAVWGVPVGYTDQDEDGFEFAGSSWQRLWQRALLYTHTTERQRVVLLYSSWANLAIGLHLPHAPTLLDEALPWNAAPPTGKAIIHATTGAVVGYLQPSGKITPYP